MLTLLPDEPFGVGLPPLPSLNVILVIWFLGLAEVLPVLL